MFGSVLVYIPTVIKIIFFDFHLNIVSMSMSILMSKFYLHCVLLGDMLDVQFKVIGLVDFVVARPNQNSIIIIIKEKNKDKILRVITIRLTMEWLILINKIFSAITHAALQRASCFII